MIKINVAESPAVIDLTDESQAEYVYNFAEEVLNKGLKIHEIEQLEETYMAKKENKYILPLLSLKMATSKIKARTIEKPLKISIVFAVYKEHNRIRKSSEHPHGEDFLLKKVEQLEWLFAGQSMVAWELIVVDDGCPEGSGMIAQEIAKSNQLESKVKVLFLEEAIDKNLTIAKNLSSTADSQKGGSIVYGMWEAINRSSQSDHMVVFTDADLSTHLGQLMLLIDPIYNRDKMAAIGSRRENKSVVLKKGARNDRGKLFIYLWKRLIPNLGSIVDTQCGFKAFRADLIPHIIQDMIESKFAFDIELLLRTLLFREYSVEKVPIAWIDSEEASKTTDLHQYLPMLKSISAMSKKYFPEMAGSNEFIPYLTSMNESQFEHLLNNIPVEIVRREPDEFTKFDGVGVTDFP